MSMTFTKLFSSITESSIWMQDDHTRIVWIAMLAMADRHGRVWASIPGLANRARVSVAAAETAIQILASPDAYSRTKDNEGRRIAEIDGGWRLLNHAKYRDMRDDESRREQNREAQRRARAKVSKPADSQHPSANASAHADADADADADPKRGNRAARFTPPLLDEVRLEAEKIGLAESEADKFHDYYTANGWQVGRSPMKEWRAALRNWQRRNDEPTKGKSDARIPGNPRNSGTY